MLTYLKYGCMPISMAEQINVKGAIKRNYSRYKQRLKSIMYVPTAAKPYVRFATFLKIALCLGVGVGWGGWGGVLTSCAECVEHALA